jgi:hypothetical protein
MPVSSSEVLNALNRCHSYANSMRFSVLVEEAVLVAVPQTNIPLIRNFQVECNLEANYSCKIEVFAASK